MTLHDIAVTIGGVSKTTSVRGLSYGRVVNGIGRASFTVTDTGLYVPADDAEVLIYRDNSLDWGGEIAEVDVFYLGVISGTSVRVTAHDRAQLAQRGLVTTVFPSQPLITTLQSLTAGGGALGDYGVTLDPTQATGPTLEAITASWLTPEALLNLLSQRTGWLWAISPTKVLGMWPPGSRSSGVTISLAQGNLVTASWRRQRYDYRNHETVLYGAPATQGWVSQTWTTSNGTIRTYPLRYVPNSAPPIAYVYYAAGGWQGFPVGTLADTIEWQYDTTNRQLVHHASWPALSVGDVLKADIPVTYPQEAIATDAGEVAAKGAWRRAESREDIATYEEALAWGQAQIRTSLPRPQVPTVVTSAESIEPGTTVTVTLPEIGLSQSCFVQQIETAVEKAGTQATELRTLTLTAGDECHATPEALWRRIISGTAGGGSSLGSGSGGGVVPPAGATQALHAHLGGSRLIDLAVTAWTAVPDYATFRAPVDGDYTLRTELQTLNAGTSVTVRLWDVTAGTAAVTGTAVTATTWTEQALAVALVAGHRYRVEVIGGNGLAGVMVGQATMEL